MKNESLIVIIMNDVLIIPELANIIVCHMDICEGIIGMARLRCVSKRLAAVFAAKTAVVPCRVPNLQVRVYSVGPLSIKVISSPRKTWTGPIWFGDEKYSDTIFRVGVLAIFHDGSSCHYRMNLAAFAAVVHVFGLGGVVRTALERGDHGHEAVKLDVLYDGRGTAKCGDIDHMLESSDRVRVGGVYYASFAGVSWSQGDIGNYSDLVRMRRVDFYILLLKYN